MMKYTIRRSACLNIFFAFLIFGVCNISQAQEFSSSSSFRSHWKIGASAGTSLFFGDLKQYAIWPVYEYENEWRLAGGLQLSKQLTPVFALQGVALYGQLSGTRRTRNMYFEADYFEFNLQSNININNIFSYREDRFVSAYLMIGVGLTNFNSEVFDLSTKASLKQIGFGNGKSFQGRTLEGIVLGGLGLDFRISDRVNITLESANRGMNSDNMDGVISGFKYDVYNYTSIGFSYKFGFGKGKGRSLPPYQQNNQQPVEQAYDAPTNAPSKSNKDLDVLIVEPIIGTIERKPPKVVIEEEPIEEAVEEVYVPVSPMSTPSPAFEYRVQVLAKYDKKMSFQQISNMYHLPVNEIKENMRNGYYIYSVGSYATYEEARQRRNQLRTSNGITDAFVVAFENGKRLDKLP